MSQISSRTTEHATLTAKNQFLASLLNQSCKMWELVPSEVKCATNPVM
jgi:hypothetical protein